MCEGGGREEVQRTVKGGAAAWEMVEGIVWGGKLKKHLKRKVLEACVAPAYIYGLGTLALALQRRCVRSDRQHKKQTRREYVK